MKALVHFLKSRWQLITLVAVLLLAAYLRLYKIADYMTFLGDEGRDALVVKRMIVDHKFTLLGPTASVGGFFLGPIYYYFMVPFLWAWRLDPTGPAVMVALVGVATVWLVYRLGKELFGNTAGLVASALYALSPVVIASSRSSWNPNVVPFFATLTIYLLWRIVATGRWQYLFWVGVCLGIGVQLHYLFLFLFPVVLGWLFLYGRSKRLLWYPVLGVAGFLVGYAPFLAFEVRHGFPNTISILGFLQTGKDTGFRWQSFSANITDVIFRLFGRLVFRLPQKEIWNSFADWQISAWIVSIKTTIFISLGILVGVLARIFPGEVDKKAASAHRQSASLILLWLLVPLFLFGLYKRSIYDYYFGIFFPLPFLLTGVVFSHMMRGVWLRLAGVVLLSYLLYLNWQGRPFLFAPNRQLEQAKRIAAEAVAKTGGKPFNFALITEYNSDHVYRYFFEVWNRAPVTIENEVVDPERKTVTDQLIVICEISNCKPLGNPLWEVAGFGRAEIDQRWDVPFVTIYKLVHWKGENH